LQPPPLSPLDSRRPDAPVPLEDALASDFDGDSPPSAPPPDDEEEDEVDVVEPEDDVAPPSVLPAVPPVTVIMRVILATPSPVVPEPFADMAATHNVIVPFVFGAVNENLYVPVAPPGGGVAAVTSYGVSTGNGTEAFCPAVTTTPSLNAASNDVRARVPATTIVTSFFEPAWTVVGRLRVMFGIAAPACGL
jgi:hypothetical protein